MSYQGPNRIASIIHSLKPGGAEIMACRLAIALKDQYPCIIIALDGDGPLADVLEENAIPYFVLRRRRGLDCGLISELAHIIRRERIVLLHAHQYTPFAYCLAARLRTRFVPVLFTEHGRFSPDRRRLRRVLMNRLLLDPRDRITAVGQSVARALVVNEGLSRDRITVIPNGVDIKEFSSVSWETRRIIRGNLGLADNDFVVVMVARLDPIKDHATALRAFEHVSAHFPQARLIVVGDGPLRKQLTQYVESRKLDKSVSFWGEQKKVLPFYQCADCFLLTSISEGTPISVLEAMACGLPIVATACGDIPRIVEHGINGFLAPVGDDALLAHYLLELARHRELVNRLGTVSRLLCQENYSWENTVACYAELYNSMLSEGSHKRYHEQFPLFC
ncbi:MAG: glycosyltransferase [Gemmatales bacterium]|nr:glycosyltransferase [Gemmatales bacterium]MDW8221856.1 glycosyltransferase [Gemmatales bacterium]